VQPLDQVGAAVDRHLVAAIVRDLAQVVEAVDVVGMVVGDDHPSTSPTRRH
jgi:hypothetical protein